MSMWKHELRNGQFLCTHNKNVSEYGHSLIPVVESCSGISVFLQYPQGQEDIYTETILSLILVTVSGRDKNLALAGQNKVRTFKTLITMTCEFVLAQLPSLQQLPSAKFHTQKIWFIHCKVFRPFPKASDVYIYIFSDILGCISVFSVLLFQLGFWTSFGQHGHR